MSGKTGIEWTDTTWNPVTGCTRVSTGCDNCYAATLANRLLKSQYTARAPAVSTPENRRDPFALRLWPERLHEPLRDRTPQMVFVNSMSDLFHADIPEPYLRRIFEVMLEGDWHVYQVLTKRPGRAYRFWRRNRDLFQGQPIPQHIWLGTSVENQKVTHRIAQLTQVPATVRFLSLEPILGPMRLDLSEIHWVIAGGESGIGFRPMRVDWVREIRDQAVEGGVPFFFKQWGGRTPKAGGRELDGMIWDQYPEAVPGDSLVGADTS